MVGILCAEKSDRSFEKSLHQPLYAADQGGFERSHLVAEPNVTAKRSNNPAQGSRSAPWVAIAAVRRTSKGFGNSAGE